MSDAIVKASWAGTAVFVLTAIAATINEQARPVAAATALGLFASGTIVFFVAYATAVGRSRTDAIGIGGLFFLAGDVAPNTVRRHLLAALAIQTAAALATAGARPFTSLAFGVLSPMYGLALNGLWAARRGRFAPRTTR